MYITRTAFWLVLLGAPFFLSAQSSNTFTIGQQVVGDIIPPTTPGNFSVTPVSSSQIDLDWDASSDNNAVSGYQVFRDAAQIATTTLTAYSDTGLTASTSYAYFVRAFDSAFNYSTSTATLSTITLASAPTSTPTTTINTQYRLKSIELLDFYQSATTQTIDLSFTTNVYTRAIIRWGRTKDYELGYIASDLFKESHTTQISGLEPGTIYEIEVIFTDRSGRKSLTETYTVSTETGPDNTAPPNVTWLKAKWFNEQVYLSWQNPAVEDFSHVRVLSSDYFYPRHTADGWLVYEGISEAVVDDRPLSAGAPRYYTVFVYDQAGNISSGAITSIVRDRAGGVLIDPVKTPLSIEPTIINDNELLPPFKFSDLIVTQNGEQRSTFGGTVIIEQAQDTVVSLPYQILPEHLKTIVMKIADPNNPEAVASFLLRVNPLKTAYEARFMSNLDIGQYAISVSMFDFATDQLFTVEGTIKVVQSAIEDQSDKNLLSIMSK